MACWGLPLDVSEEHLGDVRAIFGLQRDGFHDVESCERIRTGSTQAELLRTDEEGLPIIRRRNFDLTREVVIDRHDDRLRLGAIEAEFHHGIFSGLPLGFVELPANRSGVVVQGAKALDAADAFNWGDIAP